MNMQGKGQYLSADAGSVSEGSFSAFFSFSSWKQTGITLRQQHATYQSFHFITEYP